MKLLLVREPINNDMDSQMKMIIDQIKSLSGLNQLYGGYQQVKKIEDLQPNILAAPMFNEDIVEDALSSGKKLWKCFIAVEIDPDSFDDRLAENSSLRDWDFEEQFVYPVVNTQTVPIGALKNDQGKKLRTIFFLGQSL